MGISMFADGMEEELILTDEVVECTKIAFIKADGSLYDIEENGNITVSIEAPALVEEAQVEEQSLEVCYVPEEGEPEVLESTVTEEGISFEAEHFSVYMVRAVDARAATNVNNLDSLRNAVNSGQSNIVLTGDIVVPSSDGQGMNINGGNNITLDLNGYTIDHQGNQPLIQINGGIFTLVDSGNPANGTNGKVTFTYNVMTSTVENGATGATQETTTEYTVTAKGLIKTGSQPVFVINSGMLRMQGGTLYGGTNRAIMQNNGITELSGGYIVGFNKSVENNSSDGGAVYCNGGILNISSNVVLANNTAYRGGAIFTNYTEINMSGGYIACNQSTHAEGFRESGDHYGGGIYVNGNEMTMSGGYVTGNSASGGGGILCNGYMIIGDTNKIKVGARIALKATKQLLDHSGEVTALQDGQFSFSVVDASSKAVIATQTNDATGAIEFSERLAFTGAGIYVYEITETPGNNFDIAYDSVKYRLTVLVGEETQSFDEQISIIRCQIKNVTVERYNADTAQWEIVSNKSYSSLDDDKALEVDLTNGPSFTNVLRDKIKINVKKVWEDDGAADRPTSVTV